LPHRFSSGHCTATVDEALRAVAGVTEVKVDLEGKSATITSTAGVAALMAAVEATGKEVQHVTETVLHVEGMMWYAYCLLATSAAFSHPPCAPL
jgi:copper chaperone CopZ